MIVTIGNYKIFDSVVVSDAVQMMHDFIRHQATANVVFDDKAMFEGALLSADRNQHVSGAFNFAAFPLRMVRARDGWAGILRTHLNQQK